MTIKQMQYLDAIFKYKNFTKAAQMLYISQPSISNAITAMENELGFKLLDRNSKNVSFTPEGNKYMEYVRRVLVAYDQAEAFAEKLVKSKNSVLNIGLNKDEAIEFLRTLFDEFTQRWPNSEINVVSNSHERMIEQLMNEEIDIVYESNFEQIDETVFSKIPIALYINQAVVRKDSKLGKMDKIPLSELNGRNCIVLDTDKPWAKALIEEFNGYDCYPKMSTCFGHIISFYELISKKDFVGIIPTSIDSAVSFGFEDELVVRPLDCGDIYFYNVLVYKKSRIQSDIAKDMIKFFTNHYSQNKPHINYYVNK